jgi:hypothetical protein
VEDELAFGPDAAIFACVLGFAVLAVALLGVAEFVLTVFLLAEASLGASVCASAGWHSKQKQPNISTQAARNPPAAIFARRSCSNGKPLKYSPKPDIRHNQPTAELSPNGSWHCHHPLSDDAMPVPVG